MSHIVGLDLSLTSAGIVVLTPHPPHVKYCGDIAPEMVRCVGEAGKKTDTYAQRSRRIRTQCRAIMAQLAKFDIQLAVIEGPLYGVKTLPSYFDRAGLFHGVFGALDARNIPIAVIPPATGHQFVTGRGRVDKADIVAEVKRWWPNVHIANDDVADAAGLALMGAMHLGYSAPFRPGARHYNAIATAQWPKRGGDG